MSSPGKFGGSARSSATNSAAEFEQKLRQYKTLEAKYRASLASLEIKNTKGESKTRKQAATEQLACLEIAIGKLKRAAIEEHVKQCYRCINNLRKIFAPVHFTGYKTQLKHIAEAYSELEKNLSKQDKQQYSQVVAAANDILDNELYDKIFELDEMLAGLHAFINAAKQKLKQLLLRSAASMRRASALETIGKAAEEASSTAAAVTAALTGGEAVGKAVEEASSTVAAATTEALTGGAAGGAGAAAGAGAAFAAGAAAFAAGAAAFAAGAGAGAASFSSEELQAAINPKADIRSSIPNILKTDNCLNLDLLSFLSHQNILQKLHKQPQSTMTAY